MTSIKKINRQNVEDILPLTSIQEGMLFHYLNNPDSQQYSVQISLRISGEIELKIFKSAWRFVAENNEMLRTLYRWEKLEQPIQIVLNNYEIPIHDYDFSAAPDPEKEKLVEDIRIKDRKEKIDISTAPLRIILCKLSENKFDMIISNHHILYDGWSNALMLKEFVTAYEDLSNGKQPQRPVKIKFREFLKWYNEQDKREQRKYWAEYLKGFESKTVLPFDNLKHGEISSAQISTYQITHEMTEKIMKGVKTLQITLATFLYVAWGLMLQRYNNTEDVVFGITVSGRNFKIKGLDDVVGLFINTLPLRINSRGSEKVRDLLKKVELALWDSEAYHNTSLVDIQSVNEITGSLFDSILVVENYPLEKQLTTFNSKLKITSYSQSELTNYDLTLAVETFNGLKMNFSFNPQIFKPKTIERMADHFTKILMQMVANYDLRLSDIEMLGEEEKRQLLYGFNNPAVPYPADQGVHELIEKQATKTPDHIAVIFEGKGLTYRELNERANRVAWYLREKGVGVEENCVVGVMIERSFELITAILGVLKAGGTYMPIDPAYPLERLKYIINDSKASLLLANQKFIDNGFGVGATVIPIEGLDTMNSLPTTNPGLAYNPERLIYVLYTSGSTGNPKGVMVKCQSFVNLLNWYTREFAINEKDRVLLIASISFDLAQKNLYALLMVGGRLCLYSPGIYDYEHMTEVIKKEGVTIINCTPSAFYPLVDVNTDTDYVRLQTLTRVFLGGEPINTRKLLPWVKSGNYRGEIINTYGPTECTDIAAAYRIDNQEFAAQGTTPIGKPIDNTQIYILNQNGAPQPIGIPGELCIGGIGLARGYFNAPEMTAGRFVESQGLPSAKVYRTGDLAKWLPDGNIEFLGRIDFQVKIRGFRIELGEIENCLLKYPDIKETIVMAREDEEGGKSLYAYYVADGKVPALELKKHLSRELPDYMVPSYFLQLEKMPLTQNGKIDRKALPGTEVIQTITGEYEAPATDTERKLVEIWAEVLGVQRIGVQDNFFNLGGHSLKATVLASRIHRELNVQVPLRDVFRLPTVKELAGYIDEAAVSRYSFIQPVEKREAYPVSSAQKRMFLLSQMEGDSVAYNISSAVTIEGPLEIPRLEESFKRLIARHESLRTSFRLNDREVMQYVSEDTAFRLEYPEAGPETTPERLMEFFVRPFDLGQAPLLRVGLVQQGENRYILLIDLHHIISDGVSMEILTHELVALYNQQSLPELRIQYKDFAAWQNQLLKSETIKKQEEYWLKVFSDGAPTLNLPTDYVRPVVQSFAGDNHTWDIHEALTEQLNILARKTGTTLYMVLLAAFNVLLFKYSGQEDVVIGSPIAGRRHSDLQNIIGMFVNTLALRNKPSGEQTFLEFLRKVKENALAAYENQDYQFEELVEKLNIQRDLSRNPLFDVLFVLQNTGAQRIELDGLEFRPYEYRSRTAKFDLTLNIQERDNTLYFTLEYCAKLFKMETIERFYRHYLNVLEGVVEDPSVTLDEISILSLAEKTQILFEFNGNQANYPKHKTIHGLFAEQAYQEPDNIALVFGAQTLSYRELNQKANQVARRLAERGVRPGGQNVVALLTERSMEMIIGILGILKAGAAYLPIDPDYPEDRILYTLADSDAGILLSQRLPATRANFTGQILCLDDDEIYRGPNSNPDDTTSPGDMAYIIYTSGTTGQPKGAVISHRNVVRLLFNDHLDFDFGASDVWTMFHSICFDFSVWEIYGALLYGGKLVVIPKEVAQDTREFFQVLQAEKVTVLNQTPSAFYNLTQEAMKMENQALCLRYIIFGGEALKPSMLQWWREQYPDTHLINMYGITETTVHVTFRKVLDGDIRENISNIGRPIPTMTTYIMDKNKGLLPVGVPGELYVGGDGVGLGYLNRPELTGERFLPNPYNPGERLYRSGDLARFLWDGSMEYLGRIDHQVKIRGFRIELGEIETGLLKHPLVKDVVVLAKDGGDGNNYLCAYVKGETVIPAQELREELSKRLPDYMIPSFFIPVEEIPLTANGKVDRRRLQDLDERGAVCSEYEAPKGRLQEKLATIWAELLGMERVGIHDNFFEIGGHSLKATQLVSKIHQELGCDLPLREVFKSPTIKELAEYLNNSVLGLYFSIPPAIPLDHYPEGCYPVSSPQKRLFLLGQLEGASTSYNIPAAMVVNGPLDRKRLEESFKTLIERHETLRTSFEVVEGELLQHIHPTADFAIGGFQVGGEGVTESERIEAAAQRFVKPFDLSQAPLLRVAVGDLGEGRSLLLFDMHHIISDGWSMEILIREFTALYQGQGLPQLPIQYKDYAVWQAGLLGAGALKKQEDYWLTQFQNEIPALNLPLDYPRPSFQSFRGDEIEFATDEELTFRLKELAVQSGSTMYMVLLAAYYSLLYKYTGQNEIIVGSPIAGRSQPNLHNIIGMFVNMLALKNNPSSGKTFIQFLGEVKESALKAYDNQEYPFEKLVEKLNLYRDLSRNPLFDVVFSLQNSGSSKIKIKGLEMTPCRLRNQISKFDLTLDAMDEESKISFTLEYCSDLFTRDRMQRFSNHFLSLLRRVAESPEMKLGELDLLSNKEKIQLLHEFNHTEANYLKNKTIHEFFEERVAKAPDDTAVWFDEKQMTYDELNRKANQLAHWLRANGVRPDEIVAIMVERSFEMMIGILGVLKAGGAYLPIDPEYPNERIRYMIEDSNTQVLLTHHRLMERIHYRRRVIFLEDEAVYQGNDRNLENIATSSNLAYVIYTSGSTGRPKGVMIQHHSVVNLAEWFNGIYDLETNRRMLQMTNISFDAAVDEILPPLMYGAAVYIIRKEEALDQKKFIEFVKQNQIAIAQFVPLTLRELLANEGKIETLRKVMVGGEKLDDELRDKVLSLGYELYDHYGPAEVTVDSVVAKCERAHNTIGKPISNIKAYILDQDNQLTPVGVIGELYLSGAGVARGYLNKPELTAAKFVDNPFSPREKMYRTGDLASWQANGNITFIGRVDHQVKIRGFRIELGEIEDHLLRHEWIKEAVVIDKEDKKGSKVLCAYIVTDECLNVAEIRNYLLKELPEYMTPSYFIKVGKIPQTPNGKVDRKALPEPDGSIESGIEYVAPRNDIERGLLEIWGNLLEYEVDKISIYDPFFNLGGSSLTIMGLAGAINQKFGTPLKITDLFNYTTIEQQAAYIATFIESKDENIADEIIKFTL